MNIHAFISKHLESHLLVGLPRKIAVFSLATTPHRTKQMGKDQKVSKRILFIAVDDKISFALTALEYCDLTYIDQVSPLLTSD